MDWIASQGHGQGPIKHLSLARDPCPINLLAHTAPLTRYYYHADADPAPLLMLAEDKVTMTSRLAGEHQPSAGALDLFTVLEDSVTSSKSIPLPSSSPASHRADDTQTTTTIIAPPITGVSATAAASSSVTEPSVLGERSLPQVQNLRPPEVASPESLANHISNPKKSILRDTRDQKPLSRGPHTRLPLDENTFLPPGLSLVAPKTIQPLGRDPEPGQLKLRQPSGAVPRPRPKLVQADARAAPSPTPCPPAISRAVDQQELERHKAGDFDYLLSIPASSAAADRKSVV